MRAIASSSEVSEDKRSAPSRRSGSWRKRSTIHSLPSQRKAIRLIPKTATILHPERKAVITSPLRPKPIRFPLTLEIPCSKPIPKKNIDIKMLCPTLVTRMWTAPKSLRSR
ncbi:unknown protein [Waddlia chondrophila 2032/99]|uniref:Uncharacterized protein n=1 Tax=Waddlia chondrophila 2032/99 TaxID=765953 RepID=F8LBZ3_9BACT|nr:unknown protein [Waddlia chondrophila 2032/99]